jgi:hypothetical protein
MSNSTSAAAEWHVDAIVSGLGGVIEARLKSEQDQSVQRQLLLILSKLRAFCFPEHFERKLALHTATCLLNLQSRYGSMDGGGQHEHIMHVSMDIAHTDALYPRAMRRKFFTGEYSRNCGSLLGRGV